MSAFRAVSRLIGIAVLCLMVVNLHGAAAAAAFHTDHHCPSVSEPGQVSPNTIHPANCCTKLQCCAVVADVTFANPQVAISHLRTPLMDEANPFLLVRALYPPPKPTFS